MKIIAVRSCSMAPDSEPYDMSSSPMGSSNFFSLHLYVDVILLRAKIIKRVFTRALRGTRYDDDEEVIEAAERWFSDQSIEFYLDGIRSLRHRWTNL